MFKYPNAGRFNASTLRLSNSSIPALDSFFQHIVPNVKLELNSNIPWAGNNPYSISIPSIPLSLNATNYFEYGSNDIVTYLFRHPNYGRLNANNLRLTNIATATNKGFFNKLKKVNTRVPGISLDLTSNSPLFAGNNSYPIPVISNNLNTDTVSIKFSVQVSNVTLSLTEKEVYAFNGKAFPESINLSFTENAPKYSPITNVIPCISYSITANVPSLYQIVSIPYIQLSFNTKTPKQVIYLNKLLNVKYKQINTHILTDKYSLGYLTSSIFESGYDLLSYNKIQDIHSLSYKDSLQSLFEMEYSNSSTLSLIFEYSYEDFSRTNSLYALAYEDSLQLNAVFNSSYNDTAINKVIFITEYDDTFLSSSIMQLGYDDTVISQSIFELNYQDRSLCKNIHSTSFSESTLIKSIFSHAYENQQIVSFLFSSSYNDTTLNHSVYELSYKDTAINKSLQLLNYSDSTSFTSLVTFGFECVDLAILQQYTYSLLDVCGKIYSIGYDEENDYVQSLFSTGYAIQSQETILLTGSCYAQIQNRRIEIREVSIESDESSPYYHTSMEIVSELDYKLFSVDTEFTVHLFSDNYLFVADSKTLNRTIDSEGNLQITMMIEGLSPIVRYAEPRAQTVTKTWKEPILLSAFVNELIGSVSWLSTLPDDFIPGYRLSADHAIPISLVRSTIESIGGLVESLPDGSIRIRHLWPTSVQNLERIVPDHTLSDDVLFSMGESQDNNDYRNKFRILDADVSQRDSIEFEVNPDDGLSGTLYAYPSPWRDNLSLRHTRGPVIYLGPLSIEVYSPYLPTDTHSSESPEIIEFIEGRASVRYPIESIVSLIWLATDLGSVVFVPYTNELTAPNGDGYSLAEIRYRTRRMKAKTSSVIPTSAQYLLEELS